MKCNECKYLKTTSIFSDKGIVKEYSECDIMHIVNPEHCQYIKEDTNVVKMNICYNCSNWIGCGDWGLSCKKHYYNCSSNGFDNACNEFEPK